MGKPRLIILVRHAQSEGNKNREIHQFIPDHRVKLTEDGWRQAEEAGRRLRRLLKSDDTLQIYTSPYRRTRETTEGILKTLTAHDDTADSSPSPFSRSKITVYEEPRLREQDFGNFQPCSAEMERMWRERADYGHFFYRIPNGESAADAYDRIAGFNESLWRQFGEPDFPSVCVLVTHGLMTRVFLMKWYHWSVEYFEDLRNINHCEFILMAQSPTSGKYILESSLRTWSELKRQKAQEEVADDLARRNTLSAFLAAPQPSPSLPATKWGGCVGGCNHQHEKFPRQLQQQQQQQQQQQVPGAVAILPPAAQVSLPDQNEADDHLLAPQDVVPSPATDGQSEHRNLSGHSITAAHLLLSDRALSSGQNTPHERSEEGTDYISSYPGESEGGRGRNSMATALHRAPPQRKATPDDIERWVQESGFGSGRHADALGDGPEQDEPSGDAGGGQLETDEARDRSLRGSVY